MITPKTAEKRKKMNFMVGEHIVTELQMWIPPGERSDFVNHALDESLRRYKRAKAFQMMDELRETAKIKTTNAEFIRLKNYGRP